MLVGVVVIAIFGLDFRDLGLLSLSVAAGTLLAGALFAGVRTCSPHR
jgi:hypothetical protein